jgi:hypothetical protein
MDTGSFPPPSARYVRNCSSQVGRRKRLPHSAARPATNKVRAIQCKILRYLGGRAGAGFGAQPPAAFGEIATDAGFPEQHFHLLDSQRQFIEFGDLLTGQNLPSLRGRGPGAKAMEELLSDQPAAFRGGAVGRPVAPLLPVLRVPNRRARRHRLADSSRQERRQGVFPRRRARTGRDASQVAPYVINAFP